MKSYKNYEIYRLNGVPKRCAVCGEILVCLKDRSSGKILDIDCSNMKCIVSKGERKMIKLDRKYYLSATAHEFNIGILVKDKEDEDKFKPLYHYSTLEGVLNGYLKIKLKQGIKEDKFKTIQEIKDILPKLEKQVEIIAQRLEENGLKID